MKKNKIIFVIPSLRGGGAERIVLNIINGLNKDLFDCILVTFDSEGKYFNLISKDIKLISFNKKRARKCILGLRKIIKKEKPDIIFSSIIQANIIVYLSTLFLRRNIKIISRVSNFYSKIIESQSFLNNLLFKKSLEKSNIVIAVSEKMKQDLKEKIPKIKNKILRIYNPIDINNINKKRVEQLEDISLKKGPVIISCGRLTEQKGYEYLINSISIIERDLKGIILYILGQGKLEKQLKNLVQELNLKNNIKFLGFQENPYKYFKNADLFVLSSLWEGLPGVLIEALASGTLVVSTDCPSGPSEIIKGEYGKLVKVADSEDLAKGIIYMLDKTDRENLIKEGRKRAEDFDSKKIIKEYEKLFLGK